MKINVGNVVLMKKTDSVLNDLHVNKQCLFCLFCFSAECFSIGTIIEINYFNKTCIIYMNCKNHDSGNFDMALISYIKLVIT